MNPKKPKIKESDLQKTIIDYLRYHQYFAFKVNTIGVYIKKLDRYMKSPNRGCADILAIKQGVKPLAVECKGSGTKQSDDQKLWQVEWESHDGIYILARSVEDVEKLLSVIR